MEKIRCACGCGKEFERFDKYGRIRRYIHGHRDSKINRKMFLSKKQLRDLYIIQKLTIPIIAKQLNLNMGTIYKWLKKYNIKTRRIWEKLVQLRPKDELIKCACGCGQTLQRYGWRYNNENQTYPRRWRERKYIPGHICKSIGFQNGHDTWNKGKTDIYSKESREKMSKSHMNVPLSKKHRQNISKSLKVHTTSLKGKTFEEICGKEESKRRKENMSKALKGKTYKDLFGEEKAKSLRLERVKTRANIIFPKKDTKIETKIQDYLKELGITFFAHQYMNIEHAYQCDILIPSINLVIECDGDYWHKYPIGKDIDHIRTKELIGKGFKVLRLWENEIQEMSIEKFKEDIEIIKNS